MASNEEVDERLSPEAESIASQVEDLVDDEDYSDPEASGSDPVKRVAAAPPVEAADAGEPVQSVSDIYEQVIDPEDERYPKYFRGKPISAMAESARHANALIEEQGRRANIAEEQARVLRATIDVMRESLPSRAQTPQQSEFQRAGFDPQRDILEDPERLLNEGAEIGRRRAVADVTPRLDELNSKLENFERNQQLQQIAAASERARVRLNVPMERWAALGEYTYAKAGATNPMLDQSWEDAYRGIEKAFPQQAQRAGIPAAAVTSGNPPGGSRRTLVSSAPSPIKPRVRSMIRDMNEALGLSPEIAERIEAKLRQKEASGDSNGR